MVNFGPLTAEICWRVWGTPANFNGFCILAVLLHATLLVGVSQTLRRWTEGATYILQGSHHVGHWPTLLFLLLFFSSLILSGRLPYFHAWCGFSANSECMCEMCCMWLAGNTGCKNDVTNRHLCTIAQLSPAISSQLRHESTIGKRLLNSNLLHISP